MLRLLSPLIQQQQQQKRFVKCLASQLRKGDLLEIQGKLMQIMAITTSQSGRGGRFHQVKTAIKKTIIINTKCSCK